MKFFVKETHIEDVRQGQKITSYLLESIMKPSDPVKGELRRILMKTAQVGSQMTQFRCKIQEVGVSLFDVRKNHGFLPEVACRSRVS